MMEPDVEAGRSSSVAAKSSSGLYQYEALITMIVMSISYSFFPTELAKSSKYTITMNLIQEPSLKYTNHSDKSQ